MKLKPQWQFGRTSSLHEKQIREQFGISFEFCLRELYSFLIKKINLGTEFEIREFLEDSLEQIKEPLGEEDK